MSRLENQQSSDANTHEHESNRGADHTRCLAVQGRCKSCQIWVNKQRQMLNPPVEKVCTMCTVLKPASEFNRDSNCSDGLKVRCTDLSLSS